MGEVWQARDMRLDRTVAIKTSKEQFGERFEQEARVIARLNHPRVCQIYDVGPNYLVMELVEGAPLKGPLPIAKALEYAEQILDALSAAHQKGITHRDLKPDNILLTSQGIKLLDFGLARLRREEVSLLSTDADATVAKAITQQGHIVGTLQYMAPEQLQGKDVDSRSDLFSFGCVLYEILSGRRAFEGHSPASIIGAILEREPAPLDVAPPLERVLRRCLEKDPAERFQTAQDLKAALLWALDPPKAGSPGPRPRPHWLPWTVAGVAALSAAIVAGLWVRSPQKPEGLAAAFIVGAPAGTMFNYLITATAISQDGRFFVFRAAADSGVVSLWLRPLDSTSARPLPGTEGGDFPFWSPDGRSIGFFASGKLKRLDLVGSNPVVLSDVVDGAAGTGGAWSRDGTILFADRRGLFLIPETGGTPTQLLTADASRKELGFGYPQFLPDGKGFLYFAASSDPALEGVWAGSLNNADKRIPVVRTPVKAAYAPPFSGHPGLLLFVKDRTLMVQEFDARALRLEGSAVPLAADVAMHPALRGAAFWLSDTGLMAYRAGRALDRVKLVWRSRDGKMIREGAPEDSWTTLRLSPDGSRVALGRRDIGDPSDIWILDVERSVRTRFTFDPQADTCAVWSPDGRQLAFTSSRSGVAQIYRKDSNGAGGEEQLSDGPEAKCLTDWSRDGRWLLYNGQHGNTTDIFALPLDEEHRKPVPVIASPFLELDGQFSPDGEWVAYTSDESGRQEVHVRAFSGSAIDRRGQWQVSNEGGRAPRWRGDGQEIFYLSLEGTKLMAAGIQLNAESAQVGLPQELFPISAPSDLGDNRFPWDVSADGQRFILEQATGSENVSPLNVIVNWQAKLKKEPRR